METRNRIGNGSGQQQGVRLQIFSSAGSWTTRLLLRAARLKDLQEKQNGGANTPPS